MNAICKIDYKESRVGYLFSVLCQASYFLPHKKHCYGLEQVVPSSLLNLGVRVSVLTRSFLRRLMDFVLVKKPVLFLTTSMMFWIVNGK